MNCGTGLWMSMKFVFQAASVVYICLLVSRWSSSTTLKNAFEHSHLMVIARCHKTYRFYDVLKDKRHLFAIVRHNVQQRITHEHLAENSQKLCMAGEQRYKFQINSSIIGLWTAQKLLEKNWVLAKHAKLERGQALKALLLTGEIIFKSLDRAFEIQPIVKYSNLFIEFETLNQIFESFNILKLANAENSKTKLFLF